MAFTPVAKQLQQRLEDRRGWFRSWLSQWHQLKDPNGRVEVDLFNGRTSHMGGIAFWGSARDVYWDAITRGTRKEVLDQLAWVDEQVRRYNRQTALDSIDQSAGLLMSFVRGVRRDAVEKDRILRGDGIHFPPENDAGIWRGTSEEEIRGYAEALKSALPSDTVEVIPRLVERSTCRARLNQLWHENQWWLGPVSLIVGLAGLAALF